MFIINFIRFLFGYLVVSFSGEFAERLLNICAKNRLSIWNIKQNDGVICVSIGIKSFEKLRTLKRKCNVKVKVIKKCGIRFTLHANKLRFGIIVGVAVYFITIFYMSGFVWNIDVNSNKPIDEKKIIKQLENLGITEGMRKSDIDVQNQRIELIMSVDDLSWAALNIEGTSLSVDVTVSEAINQKDARPSNLIASKDGIIKKIFVNSGQTLIAVNQAVLKGEMLVSGIIEDKMGAIAFKHSDGEIFAETKEKISITVPFEQKRTIILGKPFNKIGLRFFNLKIPLYLGTIKFEHIKDINVCRMKLFGKEMPISLHRATFYKTKNTIENINTQQAVQIADKQFEEQISSKSYVSYSVVNKTIHDNNDSITVIYEVIGEENIALQEILSISTTN